MVSPIFTTESIKLFNCDCERLIGQAELGIPTIVITSPPYNLGGEPWPHLGNWKHGDFAGGQSKWRNGSDAGNGIQYDTHEDAMPWDDYVAWQRRVLKKLWTFLPDNGAIFYNHKPRVIGGKQWLPLELVPDNLVLRQVIIWARPGGMNFKPTAFVPTHEWIMVLAKPAFRLKSRGVSGFGDVWSMAPDRSKHPAPFPLELPRRIIEATEARFVFDPFCGAGTTLVAAKQAGIQGSGCDVSSDYCKLAISRLRQSYLFGDSDAEETAERRQSDDSVAQEAG